MAQRYRCRHCLPSRSFRGLSCPSTRSPYSAPSLSLKSLHHRLNTRLTATQSPKILKPNLSPKYCRQNTLSIFQESLSDKNGADFTSRKARFQKNRFQLDASLNQFKHPGCANLLSAKILEDSDICIRLARIKVGKPIDMWRDLGNREVMNFGGGCGTLATAMV